ncbi:MAG: dihydrolipoyl dehydrogenase [Oligoflexales bacterium]
MSQKSYDVVVIGAGPAGEVGAIRAAQLGMKVALVEKNEHLGGTCLNVGCIPTKALLHSAKLWDKVRHMEEEGISVSNPKFDWSRIMAKKESVVDAQRKGLKFLMKKNKIDVFQGTAKLENPKMVAVKTAAGMESLAAKNILLATGSQVRELPFAKSNGKNILTSDTVLFIDHVPETLAVIGGGVVGMEFASLFARMGSQVTVIELAPQVLPTEDEEVVKEFVRVLKKNHANLTIETSTKLTGVEDKGKFCVVTTEGGKPREFAKVLMSIGRQPVTADLGLEAMGISIEKGGFVKVDEHYRTSQKTVFAVGDIISTPALAHTASAEAMHAVEIMANHNPPVINYDANPNAIYTSPEIASIGKTEQKLREEKASYKAVKFPFAPLAKAKIEGATVGFIKLLYEPKYKEILGVHIIGTTATEMIAEFSLAKVLESTIDEIGHTIHPHPTISETVMEAAHAAMGGAIHL